MSTIAVGDGRSTVILSGNLPRALLYTYRAQSQFQYTECTAGCDTSTPTWTSPILLIPDGGDIDGFRRPALATVSTLTAVAGFSSTGMNLTYGE
ncbi:MAG TPA: hypothetical protein VH208_00930, partial [Myxococcaceae bacterium]|nr:hypothetical protein [Myxococcaceae bacterium]